MFWSKIWFFLVAVVAAVSLTLALLMPRPAERATVSSDKRRLARACSVTEILLRDFARSRIQLASDTARAESNLDSVLATASRGEIVSGESYAAAKKILTELDFGTKRKGDEEVPYRPDLVLALDLLGRVVARSGKDEGSYGDSLAGYYLVDDSLAGYQRDDLWIQSGQLYLLAGAPVITKQLEYAGAVVIGEQVDGEFATELAKRLDVQLTFYAAGAAVATSDPVEIHKEVLAHVGDFKGKDPGRDCGTIEPFSVSSGDKSYWALIARLPGEAGAMGAFYAVYIPQTKEIGFSGTIDAVKKDDLSFSRFPWIKVGILFLLMIGVGLGLLIFETDRPLRKLGNDAVKLAKGESERLAEESHRGKFGSIARSVNIAIDKLHRETRAAKKDLDNLLGPLPDEAAVAAVLPPMGPVADLSALAPPPPSEFRFSDNSASSPGAGPFDPGAPPAPPTNEHKPPPPVALPPAGKRQAQTTPRPKPPVPPVAARRATPQPMAAAPSIQEDILGGGRPQPVPMGKSQVVPIDQDDDDEDTRVADGPQQQTAPAQRDGAVVGSADDAGQYRAIYDEFLALKVKCGESVENLTYDRFLTKLRSNRDALIAKHGCKAVKFQVYVKDGKAALKASPVR
ncbi:MAG TPA: MXAN_5187 family protein [Kofleriaceae bacterium]|nr:MXAN_5187 family protein [Kofleriaceae bacterium]